jgi:hypothetical protein
MQTDEVTVEGKELALGQTSNQYEVLSRPDSFGKNGARTTMLDAAVGRPLTTRWMNGVS